MLRYKLLTSIGAACMVVLLFSLQPAWSQPDPAANVKLPAVTSDNGCYKPPPPLIPRALQVDNRSREFITVLPPNYDETVEHALILAFHGRTDSATKVRGYFDLERHAWMPTIFVYPSGLRDGSGGYTWWKAGDAPHALRDFAFFDAIVDRFRNDYCIGNVYVIGYSLGASFTNSLGCARGDRIRAIASLAGGIDSRNCKGQTAAMILHNDDDEMVPIELGEYARERYRRHLGYANDTVETQPQSYDCERYGPATSAFPLLWCEHGFDETRWGRDYPHNWPAGTGAHMMRFFSNLPEDPGLAAR